MATNKTFAVFPLGYQRKDGLAQKLDKDGVPVDGMPPVTMEEVEAWVEEYKKSIWGSCYGAQRYLRVVEFLLQKMNENGK